VHGIITDGGLPKEALEALQTEGIEVILA